MITFTECCFTSRYTAIQSQLWVYSPMYTNSNIYRRHKSFPSGCFEKTCTCRFNIRFVLQIQFYIINLICYIPDILRKLSIMYCLMYFFNIPGKLTKQYWINLVWRISLIMIVYTHWRMGGGGGGGGGIIHIFTYFLIERWNKDEQECGLMWFICLPWTHAFAVLHIYSYVYMVIDIKRS